MFKISKLERDFLESNGCKFPYELHKTLGTSKHCTYYASETNRVLDLLKEYKDKHVTERHVNK